MKRYETVLRILQNIYNSSSLDFENVQMYQDNRRKIIVVSGKVGETEKDILEYLNFEATSTGCYQWMG